MSDLVDAMVEAHVRALRECNQRGGRLLSLVDLIGAGTVDFDLAAYLAAVMRSGGSLLVGARPGGAGKTAVMVALLNFLPDATAIQPVEGPAVLRRGLADTAYGATCYLAHEIGAGFYYAYLWNEDARLFFELAGRGHTIVSNLHADTLDELHAQLSGRIGVAPEHVRAITLKVFLRVGRGPNLRVRRWVSRVYEAGEDGADHLVWVGERWGQFARREPSRFVTPEAESACRDLLVHLSREGVVTIEAVRHAVVQNLRLTIKSRRG